MKARVHTSIVKIAERGKERRMSYALPLPSECTQLIGHCRDWRLEEVRRDGGTPSRLALRPFRIRNWFVDPSEDDEERTFLSLFSYYIEVYRRDCTDGHWVYNPLPGGYFRAGGNEWASLATNEDTPEWTNEET